MSLSLTPHKLFLAKLTAHQSLWAYFFMIGFFISDVLLITLFAFHKDFWALIMMLLTLTSFYYLPTKLALNQRLFTRILVMPNSIIVAYDLFPAI